MGSNRDEANLRGGSKFSGSVVAKFRAKRGLLSVTVRGFNDRLQGRCYSGPEKKQTNKQIKPK